MTTTTTALILLIIALIDQVQGEEGELCRGHYYTLILAIVDLYYHQLTTTRLLLQLDHHIFIPYRISLPPTGSGSSTTTLLPYSQPYFGGGERRG